MFNAHSRSWKFYVMINKVEGLSLFERVVQVVCEICDPESASSQHWSQSRHRRILHQRSLITCVLIWKLEDLHVTTSYHTAEY